MISSSLPYTYVPKLSCFSYKFNYNSLIFYFFFNGNFSYGLLQIDIFLVFFLIFSLLIFIN